MDVGGCRVGKLSSYWMLTVFLGYLCPVVTLWPLVFVFPEFPKLNHIDSAEFVNVAIGQSNDKIDACSLNALATSSLRSEIIVDMSEVVCYLFELAGLVAGSIKVTHLQIRSFFLFY